MDDATTRAREVIAALVVPRPANARELEHSESFAENLVATLARAGFQIIDTLTHAAVPREPGDEVVERVARAIYTCGMPDVWDTLSEGTRDDFREEARAAIAALVGTQTQGGEPDAPP